MLRCTTNIPTHINSWSIYFQNVSNDRLLIYFLVREFFSLLYWRFFSYHGHTMSSLFRMLAPISDIHSVHYLAFGLIIPISMAEEYTQLWMYTGCLSLNKVECAEFFKCCSVSFWLVHGENFLSDRWILRVVYCVVVFWTLECVVCPLKDMTIHCGTFIWCRNLDSHAFMWNVLLIPEGPGRPQPSLCSV